MKTFFKLTLLIFISFSGCKKFVDPGIPNSQLVSEAVFQSDQSANAAITGLYALLIPNTTGSFLNYQITLFNGLMADELIAPAADNKEFYQNTLNPEVSSTSAIWENGYGQIYRANAILKGLNGSEKLSPDLKKQLEGEARFMRALCHFYLLNLYGDIPYITTTDYTVNSQAYRLPVKKVYELILQDLTQSAILLPDTYTSEERIRPNKSTDLALMARVYLYTGDWSNAERTATQIIDQKDLYQLSNIVESVFLKNSHETIWQLKSSISNFNTVEGNWFILTAAPTESYLSSDFVKSFEKNDLRKIAWIDSLVIGDSKWHYPAKYKVKNGATITENMILFRLAEQYLIRSEACVRLGKLSQAIEDIDVIRQRAGLALIKEINPSISAESLLLVIENERKAEFFAEMGHRWFDLKRTNRANAILSKLKAPNWQKEDQLMPIPKSQIDRDPNIIQNPGY
ncbi:hypothetical protein HDF26_002323 [Pedobacter cryoconitis]|uniref:RagB/SusD family nutrient uptake outer membrane protein n=1 Tax=Pedobacter cryoconitis TaxID=188932 RepID=UPI001619E4E7|nr:RagB/SusD family nutrient uptake outer membrane protein [Pedobacter cryoconitis]MBB6271866.1 hypothetical protein [Pedobacter cryoconitis]